MKRLALILLSSLAPLLPLPTHANDQPPLLPTPKEAREVCRAVINPRSVSDKITYRHEGAIDVNNDGLPEKLHMMCTGSAHACSPFIDMPKNQLDWPYEPGPDSEGLEGSRDIYSFAVAEFRHKNYMIYYADDSYVTPVRATFITPENKELRVCVYHDRRVSGYGEMFKRVKPERH